MEKRCIRCGETKPNGAFYFRTGTKLYHSMCKDCERADAKKWYESNRDAAKEKCKAWRMANGDKIKQYRRNNRAKLYRQEVVRKYGVSPSWFDETIAEQQGKCAACGVVLEYGTKSITPHVDHCHKTLSVRGILCNRCNSVIGLCEDSCDILSKLSEYLKCHGI